MTLRPTILTIIHTIALTLTALAIRAATPTARIYHDGLVTLTDSAITLPSPLPPAETEIFTTEARVAIDNIKERRGLSAGSWTLSIIPVSGPDTLRMRLEWGNTDFGDLLDRRFTRLTVTMAGSVLDVTEPEGFASAPGTYNTLRATLSPTRIELYGGHRGRSHLCGMILPRPVTPEASEVAVTGTGTVSLLVNEATRSHRAVASTSWTAERLDSALAVSTDPIEGHWQYLDRDNDPRYARPGGRYHLAVVADGTGGYDILYLGGAQILPAKWLPFMRKGRLRPTNFIGHYELSWIDSEFEEMTTDIHADLTTSGSILALSFPLLHTTMRFSRADHRAEP